MRKRLALLVATSMLVVPASLASAKQPDKPVLPCSGPLACADDSVVTEMEQRIADNFRFGQAIEINYRTPERILGDVANGFAWGDSALWTGVYLAGESMRYAVAKDKLKKLDKNKNEGDPEAEAAIAEWTAQRDEALARARLMTNKFHLLSRIGKEWKTSFSPSTTPPSFGGGVFQGEEGLLMRGCAPKPADTPDGIGIAPNANKRVFGPFYWDDGRDNGIQDKVEYYCETAPSRDSYAGTLYGLLYAYDLVGKDDPELRAQIRGDVLVLAGRLVKYGWSFPRPHGNISTPVDTRIVPVVGGNGHDFDNFMSPTFMQQVPSARLNVAQSAWHVSREGTAQEKAFWDAVWAEERATQLPALAGQMAVDAAQPSEGYFKFNLNHLTMTNILRLEPDPTAREIEKQALGVMDKTTGDDGNAHFESMTYAVSGEPRRVEAAVKHLEDWVGYRRAIETGPVRNSDRCNVSGGIECVPNGQLDIDQDGRVVTVPDPATLQPGATPRMRARFPLPVAQRTPTDFLWQRPPTQLDGSAPATHQAPGIDYLTPYWTIRYYTEVAKPELAPLPVWAGPAHR